MEINTPNALWTIWTILLLRGKAKGLLTSLFVCLFGGPVSAPLLRLFEDCPQRRQILVRLRQASLEGKQVANK